MKENKTKISKTILTKITTNYYLRTISKFYAYLILLIVILVDQVSKFHYQELLKAKKILFLNFSWAINKGIIWGLFAEASNASVNLLVIICYGFLLYLFLFLQKYLRPEFFCFKVGISIFFGGITGNIIDKIFYGYVRDFLYIFEGHYFNIADFFQFFGIGFIVYSIIRYGKRISMPNEKNKRYVINKKYQSRYARDILIIIFSLSIMLSAISMFFFIILDINKKEMFVYLACTSISTLAFCVFIFILSFRLSNKIAGPIFALKRYVLLALSEKNSIQTTEEIKEFRVRKNDNFKEEIEEISRILEKNRI